MVNKVVEHVEGLIDQMTAVSKEEQQNSLIIHTIAIIVESNAMFSELRNSSND
jgi:hypothetical protein